MAPNSQSHRRSPICGYGGSLEEGYLHCSPLTDPNVITCAARGPDGERRTVASRIGHQNAHSQVSCLSRIVRKPDTSCRESRRLIRVFSVSQIQGKLSANLGAPVAAPRSQTSLQLSLENPRLEGEQERYVTALHALGEQDNDIVGYAFAINGRLNSADIYPSNGLFRKMWPKLLRASATEAIAARDAANEPAPPKATITEFFGAANSTRGIETSAAKPSRVEIRESSKALLLEARPAAAPASAWVHRNYLAK
jgi:hypothetical protein